MQPTLITGPDQTLDEWITKNEAARGLQLSTRSIERMIAEGKLRSAKRRSPGQIPETVIHPDDYRAQMAGRSVPAPLREAIVQNALQFMPQQPIAPPAPPPQNMNLSAAAAYTGLPRLLLKRAIEAGHLPAHRWANSYFLHRADLDAFRPAPTATLAWTKGGNA